MNLSRLALVLGSILALAVGYRAAMGQLERFSLTPGSNNAASPYGAAEGIAPSSVNDIMRQMMTETARDVKQAISAKFGIAGGSVDAILVTPAILWNSYISGQVIRFVSTGANTSSAPTVNIGGLGAVTVAKISNQALAAADIPSRGLVEMVYHGGLGGFVLTSVSSASQDGITGLPAQSISGTVLSTNGSTASFISAAFLDIAPHGFIGGYNITPASLTTITVARGSATDDTGSTMIRLDAPLTKSVAGTWVAGTGQNGLDTGSVENNQWYHVLAIRSVAGVKDVLLTKTITNVVMPAGYQWKRRIGSFRTNGSAQVTVFVQQGDRFWWATPVTDVDATNPGTGAVTRILTVPTGVEVVPILAAHAPGTTTSMLLTSLDQVDTAPVNPTMFSVSTGSGSGAATPPVKTNTSAQIRTRASTSGLGERYVIITHGWVDRRGQDE